MPKEDDMDFEIRFYEGLLKKKPDFIDALSAIGDLYTKKGFYEKGLRVDEKLVILRPCDPIVLYNLSCSYSLVNQIDKSFRAFKKAINCGYCDFDHLEKDDDLLNLRKDPRFQKYYIRLLKKTPQKSID